jgi:photosystem II stability/assembly factor-like uncharacterized protein
VAKRISLLIAVFTLVATSLAFAGSGRSYRWQLTPTPTDPTARFRGVSAVSERTAWVSGWQGPVGNQVGIVLRTTDKGASWQLVAPPGAQGLQFRDVEAFDADTALIMSIGNTPDAFRIYRTTNGGESWTLVFQNTEPTAFYDCMAFFDKHRGLALSDPINGRFRILATSDGGATWRIVNADMPPALPTEFAFAASGQCITTAGGRDAWFGTGGDAIARVFHSDDRGRTWTVANTPIRSSLSAGISALAFRDPRHGIAVGGDFAPGTASPDALALTNDGGATWQLNPNAPDELRSGAHWVTGRDAIIVGPSGSDVSFDQGRTWVRFDNGSFDTVDCAGGFACWAAGAQGRVAFLVRER